MTNYTIKAGNHYSAHFPKLYTGKKQFKISVLFDESCRYDLGNADQFDINKLWGVSFGMHETNSIRIGWRYNPISGRIILYSYTYEEGVRKFQDFKSVAINEVTEIHFTIKSNSYDISYLEGGIEVPYNYPSMKIGYYLFPYFGGNQVAPHDINIKLDVK